MTDHLRDEHWRWVKHEREKAVGWQCEWPGCADGSSDGHHVTYANVGHERPDDIRLLCRRHHDTVHADERPTVGQLTFDDVAPDPFEELAHYLASSRLLPGEVLAADWRRNVRRIHVRPEDCIPTGIVRDSHGQPVVGYRNGRPAEVYLYRRRPAA